MEEQRRLAVRASLAWYADVFEAHGIPTRADGRVWRTLAPPPRWHSAAKTLRPGVGASEVVAAVAAFPSCAVADSFADLDLSDAGFRRLFTATWVHRTTGAEGGGWPEGWFVVSHERDLAEWNAAHDTSGVLLPSLLAHPRFRFLACRSSGRLVAGGVLHRAPGAVEVSNTWSTGDPAGAVAGVLACASALVPGEALVGYAEGEELERLTSAGFAHCGDHVVWVREGVAQFTAATRSP